MLLGCSISVKISFVVNLNKKDDVHDFRDLYTSNKSEHFFWPNRSQTFSLVQISQFHYTCQKKFFKPVFL